MSNKVDKIIKAYAEDLDGLTMEECAEAEFSPDQCDLLTAVLGKRADGEITPAEQTQLEQSGFAKDFIKGIAGDDGNKALQARVRWLGDQIVPRMHSRICLANCDGLKREYAIYALRKIGPAAREAVPALIQALKDEDVSISFNASDVLFNIIDPAAKDVVPFLIQTLKDENRDVRFYAAYLLANIGHPAAIPPLAVGKKQIRSTMLAPSSLWPGLVITPVQRSRS